MRVPEEALNNATGVLLVEGYINDTSNPDILQWRTIAHACLAAALPAVEAALRKQIAADIRAGADPAFDFDFDPDGQYARGYRHGIQFSARITKEGK